VSDFGLDAYALDEGDSSGHPHPLEIARNLIATGKPRSALEVLSLHHDRLADDPEYLLLCAEAWLADGDVLRAQQALLGAARLDSEDPRPLRFLGELLAERGEHQRAEGLLAKARALEVRANDLDETPEPLGPDAEDDLIAFAERQDRRHRAALTPQQLLLGALALCGVAVLIAAIARIAGPQAEVLPSVAAPPAESTVRQDLAPPTEPAPRIADLSSEEPAPRPEASIETDLTAAPALAPSVETPRLPPEPPLAAATPAAAKPEPKVTSRAPVASSRPSRRVTAPPPDEREKEPDATLVQAELASMNAKQLTARGDALQAKGHTAFAASYYRRALELDPDYAPALVGIGDSLLRAKVYADAMRNATRALQLARGVDARPGLEALAIYQMGRVHFERGEKESARDLFRQSISLRGTPSDAWFYLGEALASENSPAARTAYQKYLELVPTGQLANRARRAIQ